MSMSQHTQEIGELRLIGKQGTAIWMGDEIVASVAGARDSHKNAREFAEFIVNACNAHADLFNALCDLVVLADFEGEFKNRDKELQRARLAIAKAEGQS